MLKTRLLLLTLVLSTIFTGCNKDDEEAGTKLVTTELSVKSGQTSQIVIEPSSAGCKFISDNRLIASVSSTGEVKGLIIGETSVSISNPETGFSGKSKITVTPQYQMYTEPYLQFGATTQQIKAFEKRQFISEDNTAIGYRGENSNITLVLYTLENSRLKSASCLIPASESSAEMLIDFLSERYILNITDDNDIIFISVDEKIAGGIRSYTNGGVVYYMVLYIEYPSQPKSIDSSVFEEIRNLIDKKSSELVIPEGLME